MEVINLIESNLNKLKHVMFFHSHSLWPSHFETELELIELLKKQGVKVSAFTCNGALIGCDINPENDLNICSRCINTRKKGHRLISSLNEINIKINNKKLFSPLFEINSIDELKNQKYKNFEVGYAVLSSIVSSERNPYITYHDYKTQFDDLIRRSINAYEYFISKLELDKPDAVIVFNGRFAYTRALVRACEALDIKYFTHERGANKNKYMLFENSLPHDISYFNKLLQMSWDNSNVSENDKISIGNQFYIDRANGKQQSWFSFTEKQNRGRLPENWDGNKHNIVIYLSSEDEFIAIGDLWGKTLFKNQIEGLKNIFNYSFNSKIIKFYIRIHPNSKTLKQFIKEIREFESEQISIIDPDSTICSYTLLNKCDKIISFGSTMGIEATYWGKASVNLGNSFYKGLDVTYNPDSIQEAVLLINNFKLLPLANLNTIKYGYHLSTFGYDFKLYQPECLMKGTFNGVDLATVNGDLDRLLSNQIKLPYLVNRILMVIEISLRKYFLKIKIHKND